MKDKKNIDRIFQEKFRDFEQSPNEQVWKNIKSNLEKKNKKRPFVIPLWWKVGGVAAVLAIMATVLWFPPAETGESSPTLVNEESKIENEPDQTQVASENSKSKNRNSGSEVSGTGKSNSADQPVYSEDRSSEVASSNSNRNRNISDEEKIKDQKGKSYNSLKPSEASAVAQNSDTKVTDEGEKEFKDPSEVYSEKEPEKQAVATKGEQENTKVQTDSVSKSLEEAIAKNESEEVELEMGADKKFRISTFAAPVFYTNLGSGNEISRQFNQNSSSSEVTVAYGMKVAYKLSDKIKIRTGVTKLNMNQTTGDISYTPTAIMSSVENISGNRNGDYLEIESSNPGPIPSFDAPGDGMSTSSSVFIPGEIQQQFGFIEIPLEVEYSLIDKKFGLNLIGGASSLFLDDNRVDLVSGETRTDLGEATNINKTSFSTNVGIGLSYSLSSSIMLNVEPMFKYQLNTFDNVDNVQPANFGIYSGLSFRF